MTPDGSSMVDLRLSLGGGRAHVGLAGRLAEVIADELGADSETSHDIGLAVHEAAVNALRHGHRDQPDRPIEVRYSARPGHLQVIVADTGPGFDLDDRPMPPPVATSGRGLPLMRALSQRIRVQRIPAGGCEVHLEKSWPTAVGHDQK
jgi:serine/threonine-protein kinase RsbW